MSKNGFLERSKGNTLDFNDYTISGVWVFSDTGFINGPSVYRGGILGLLYWLLRNMDYLCTAHGVVHIRIGWHRLVPDHPFFNHVKEKVCHLPQLPTQYSLILINCPE